MLSRSVILTIIIMGVKQNGYQRLKECDEISKTATLGEKVASRQFAKLSKFQTARKSRT